MSSGLSIVLVAYGLQKRVLMSNRKPSPLPLPVLGGVPTPGLRHGALLRTSGESFPKSFAPKRRLGGGGGGGQ
eukprot:6937355-Pyramimonas_sp.AAC.1